MILAEETTKYLGDNEGVLNVQLMMKLLQVVAYNLAKSRTARDGNKLKRKNFRPRHIKVNHPVVMINHTAKPFHLPLKRFLEKNTLNAKVNNWAVELESQKIDFVFIQGTKNVLADTLSRLIEIDDDIKLPAEQEGHEFGYVPFEQLPPAQVTLTEKVIINEVNDVKVKIQHIDPVQKDIKIELPILNLKLKELQSVHQKTNPTRTSMG